MFADFTYFCPDCNSVFDKPVTTDVDAHGVLQFVKICPECSGMHFVEIDDMRPDDAPDDYEVLEEHCDSMNLERHMYGEEDDEQVTI